MRKEPATANELTAELSKGAIAWLGVVAYSLDPADKPRKSATVVSPSLIATCCETGQNSGKDDIGSKVCSP